MKRIIKSPYQGMKTAIMALVASVCVAAMMFACNNNDKDKPDDAREIAESIEVYSGYHKIEFRWKITNSGVERTVISWKQGSENKSLTVPLSGGEWQEALLDDMEEDIYYFTFVMQERSGNSSNSIEIPGVVFGDNYIESLNIRGARLERQQSGQIEVIWSAVSSATLQHSVVEYLNDGVVATKEAANSESSTLLPSTANSISIYAVHLPKNGMETLNSPKSRIFLPKNPSLLDKALFEAYFLPGDNTTPQPGNSDDAWKNPLPAEIDQRDIRALWDGNIRNDPRPDGPAMRGILHTVDQSNDWANALFKYPHCFTFSVGVQAYLTDLKFHARGEQGAFTGHIPRYFEVWATDNPKTLADFENEAAFELYYRTTYVNHRAIDEQIQTNPNGNAAYTGQEWIATHPAGINNWQNDWFKIGDFENRKPSGLNFNQANDDDRAVWGNGTADLDIMTCGFDHVLTDVDTKVKYIRLVVKYPNWQHTNCINIGELTFWGDNN